MPSYPTDPAEREDLADQLAASGFIPTQVRRHFDPEKIKAMVAAMAAGTFDWTAAGLQSVILGPAGEVINGHHRVVAAYLAGIDLAAVPGPRPQVQLVPRNFRPTYDWLDVLP